MPLHLKFARLDGATARLRVPDVCSTPAVAVGLRVVQTFPSRRHRLLTSTPLQATGAFKTSNESASMHRAIGGRIDRIDPLECTPQTIHRPEARVQGDALGGRTGFEQRTCPIEPHALDEGAGRGA